MSARNSYAESSYSEATRRHSLWRDFYIHSSTSDTSLLALNDVEVEVKEQEARANFEFKFELPPSLSFGEASRKSTP